MGQNNSQFIATGRRKTSVARVRVKDGTGRVAVNGKTLDEYFGGLGRHKKEALKPIEIFASANKYDFAISVYGGGQTGQSGAIRHALARVLIKIDPGMKPNLKKEGLLTRDPRMVERKKPGRPKARKRFQFSKR
jgi:small subunit ribosomal protein S9